ncbi:MAG: hypothetical protein ACREID_09995, partial [Planctomycetota bacterium]
GVRRDEGDAVPSRRAEAPTRGHRELERGAAVERRRLGRPPDLPLDLLSAPVLGQPLGVADVPTQPSGRRRPERITVASHAGPLSLRRERCHRGSSGALHWILSAGRRR